MEEEKKQNKKEIESIDLETRKTKPFSLPLLLFLWALILSPPIFVFFCCKCLACPMSTRINVVTVCLTGALSVMEKLCRTWNDDDLLTQSLFLGETEFVDENKLKTFSRIALLLSFASFWLLHADQASCCYFQRSYSRGRYLVIFFFLPLPILGTTVFEWLKNKSIQTVLRMFVSFKIICQLVPARRRKKQGLKLACWSWRGPRIIQYRRCTTLLLAKKTGLDGHGRIYFDPRSIILCCIYNS